MKRRKVEAEKQLEDSAFTIKGWCLIHDIKHRTKYQEINAYSVKTAGISTIQWERELGDKPGNGPKARPSVSYTQRELGEAEDISARFLVVGLALPQAQLERMDIHLSQSAGRGKIGLEKPDAEFTIDLDEEDSAFLVVAPVRANQTHTQYGVILNPNEGLCTPYLIRLDDVLFFDEFRNGSTSVAERRRQWSAGVLERCKIDGEELPGAEEEERFSGDYDPTKLIVEPSDAIETRDDEASNYSMRKFLDLGELFDGQDATGFVDAFKKMWPEVEGIDRTSVLLLRKAMQAADGELEHAHLRGYVAEGVYAIPRYERECKERQQVALGENEPMLAVFFKLCLATTKRHTPLASISSLSIAVN